MANDAWEFFEEVAKNTLEWKPVSVDDKQPTAITTTNRGGMHRVNPNFESDAKLTSVVRRLEALELNKGEQSSARELSKPVTSSVCILCDNQDHLVEQYPRLPIIKAEQANALNTFRKPNPTNNPFSETYNPGRQNHPNLSWKSSQGQGYSGSPSLQGPPPNNQFNKVN